MKPVLVRVDGSPVVKEPVDTPPPSSEVVSGTVVGICLGVRVGFFEGNYHAIIWNTGNDEGRTTAVADVTRKVSLNLQKGVDQVGSWNWGPFHASSVTSSIGKSYGFSIVLLSVVLGVSITFANS